MYKKFSDLASNERTYLSWVRTSITVMAFGFLIEKFELFIQMFNKSFGHKHNFQLSDSVETIGISMMAVAIAMLILASIRYLKQRKYILDDYEHDKDGFSPILGTLLAVFLIAISLLLMIYVVIRIIPVT